MPESLEICANCDRKIGRLETPMLWESEVVCSDCHQVLSKAKARENGGFIGTASRVGISPDQSSGNALESRNAARSLSNSSINRTSGGPLQPGQIICPNPNCSYVGKPETLRRGSYLIAILLMFVVPVPFLAFESIGLIIAALIFIIGFIYFIVGPRKERRCPACKLKFDTEIL